MERTNKKRIYRRRRIIAAMLIASIAVGLVGCSTGGTFGLSAMFSTSGAAGAESGSTGQLPNKGETPEEGKLTNYPSPGSGAGSGQGQKEQPDAGAAGKDNGNGKNSDKNSVDGGNKGTSNGESKDSDNDNNSSSNGNSNGKEGSATDREPEAGKGGQQKPDSGAADGDAKGGGTTGTTGNSGAAKPTSPPKGQDSAHKQQDKVIALTFDDGPDKRYTPAILDILKEKGVAATFFVVGLQVEKDPDVLKRIVEEGHAIGNHSSNHKDLSKLSKEQVIKEMLDTDKLIEEAVGFTPEMFRAPYGAVNDTVKNVMKAYNRDLIGWNIDTRDWAGTTPAAMRTMVRKEAKPGGMILMHSFGGKNIKNTVEALPHIIDDLKKSGYRFVTADKI